jgi:hypothetical protein
MQMESPVLSRTFLSVSNTLLNRYFNIRLLKGEYPTLLKQVAIMPPFKKPSSALVTNYRPITILDNFLKYV